jgi:beta-glucosidase
VADVLFGKLDPAGRLPVSLPRAVGQVPLYYNHKPSGARSQWRGNYVEVASGPLFPFGHGLSYARFDYANLELRPRALSTDGTLEVALDVANTAARAGEEVVQLYVRDRVASLTRPVKELLRCSSWSSPVRSRSCSGARRRTSVSRVASR